MPFLHLLIAALATVSGPARASTMRVEAVASPSAPGSAQPNLTGQGDTGYLSWLEKKEGGYELRFSRWQQGGWSPPRVIASGADLLANWADFPSLLVLQDGSLVAHWPVRTPSEKFSYDVLVSRSTDGGQSWSKAVRPHRDETQTEHGFVSLLDRGAGRFATVWLDGRRFAEAGHGAAASHGNEMMLMVSNFRDGAFEPETTLDPRVCDCCPTAAAATASGIFVAYRDRSETDVRDIAYVRYENGQWSRPQALHDDGWEIPACPVNGPAVSAAGDRLVVVWFTAAGQKSRVLARFSDDGGRSFGPVSQLDQGNPAGRVDVELLGDGSALVSWLERGEAGKAEVRARRVRAGGAMEEPFTVAQTAGSRASGFPRMTRFGDTILVAWTEPGEPSHVRTARIVP